MAKMFFNRLEQVGKTYGREIFAVFFLLVGIYFFRKENSELSSLVQHLHRANFYWVLAGIIVTILYILLQSGMYVSSYSAIGARIRWIQALELFLKRNFLSVFLPAGGISSLAYSPVGLRKSGLSKMQSGQASAIYAFVGIFTILIVGLPVLVFSIIRSGQFIGAVGGLSLAVLLLVTIFWAVRSIRKKRWLYHQISNHFPKFLPQLNETLGPNVSPSQFWLTTIYSLGVELCGILHLFIAAMAFGLPVSLQSSAIAYVVSVLLMLVSPFLRGLGAVELSMVYLLGRFGMTSVNALAITILYRLFEFWLPLLAGVISFVWKGRHIMARLFPALLVFALGVVNILSVVTPPIASRLRLLKSFLPIESIHESNLVVLLIGLILMVISAFLIRGQRNAWIMAMVLSMLSLFGHMFKALDYEEAILAASVLIVLAASAGQYRLKIPASQTQLGLITVVYVFGAVLLFESIGFYFLEKKAFGFELNWWQSILFSAKSFLLMVDDKLEPATRFGREFLRLTQALGFFTWSFLVFVLLRPFFVRKAAITATIQDAHALLELYGASPVDYFKLHKDKLLFFSDRHDAFVAYRIANGFAVVLEEPVCADVNKIAVLQEFDGHCHKMGLKTAFYRVDESGVSYFNYLKKHKMLIGQEAVLELDKFSLEGREKKSLRNALNSLNKKGYTTVTYRAPLPAALIEELKEVSNTWLDYYKRKEIVFSQGRFDAGEIEQHDVIAVRDANGKLKAFLNIIPDFAPGECTYDMIRKTADAPGGCMDALIIELVQYARAKDLKYLNLGLVPMAGIPQPGNTAEQLMCYASEKLKRFRHYTGLREFKEKYASVWLNKYLIYENDFDLLQLPVALNKVMRPLRSKLKPDEKN